MSSLHVEACYGEGVLIDEEMVRCLNTSHPGSAIYRLQKGHFDGPIVVQNGKERVRFDNRNNELNFYGENGEFISYKINKMKHTISLKKGKDGADYCDVFTYKADVSPGFHYSPREPISRSREQKTNRIRLYNF